jgi:hypothetical protein
MFKYMLFSGTYPCRVAGKASGACLMTEEELFERIDFSGHKVDVTDPSTTIIRYTVDGFPPSDKILGGKIVKVVPKSGYYIL